MLMNNIAGIETVAAEFILVYTLTFLLIAFGIWVYRKIELRSLPWALAYLTLGIVSGIIFYGLIQPHFSSPRNNSPTQFETYFTLSGIWTYINQLLLAVLVLADCSILITKAGGNLTGKFARFWRWIYDKSTIFGWVLIASLLIQQIWSLVYCRIL